MVNSYSFHVNQSVEISLNEEAFTEEFLSEYRTTMFDFDIYGHAEHISQLVIRGLIPLPIIKGQTFEGYGDLSDFVSDIKVSRLSMEPVICDE